jgi:hypothetical protein
LSLDAGRGDICGLGEDHAGLPDERNVQALDGGARLVHVPARHASSGETD